MIKLDRAVQSNRTKLGTDCTA